MNNQKSSCCGGRILHNNQCEICGGEAGCYLNSKNIIVGKPIQSEENIAHNLMNKLLFGNDTSKYFPDQKGKRLHL